MNNVFMSNEAMIESQHIDKDQSDLNADNDIVNDSEQ